jgi:hypothetical protein
VFFKVRLQCVDGREGLYRSDSSTGGSTGFRIESFLPYRLFIHSSARNRFTTELRLVKPGGQATDSLRSTSIPAGGGRSVCRVVLLHRLSSRFARRFLSTVCTDRRRGLIACEQQQPEIGEEGCVSLAIFFGAALGAVRHTLLDLSGAAARDGDLCPMRYGVISLIVHV